MKSLIKLKGNKINIFQKQIYSLISLIFFLTRRKKNVLFTFIFRLILRTYHLLAFILKFKTTKIIWQKKKIII